MSLNFALYSGYEKRKITRKVLAVKLGVTAFHSSEIVDKRRSLDRVMKAIAGFEMLVLKEGRLEKLPIEKWIEAIEARNAKEPPPTDGQRTTLAAFPLVEVTGSAAVVKGELTRGGRLVFTDYLSLYRFEDGWKIVGKILFRHPAD